MWWEEGRDDRCYTIRLKEGRNEDGKIREEIDAGETNL
jgi:hypothetical protein